METWLDSSVSDSAIVLVGLSIHHQDWTKVSGKCRGGGVCIMTKKWWCVDVQTVLSGCSPNLERLMIKCRPFYLPREFITVFCSTVYIPLHGEAMKALNELYDVFDWQEARHPLTEQR